MTQRAHTFLTGMLRPLFRQISHSAIAELANSQYGSPDITQQMKDIFDKTTKPRFRDTQDPQYIKFGTVRDRDLQYDIRSGVLKISG